MPISLTEKADVINRIAGLSRDFVTLNGNPALITGLSNDYLTVVTLTPDRLHHDWSWEAASRILAKGGAFKS
jgi:hypothetical protein